MGQKRKKTASVARSPNTDRIPKFGGSPAARKQAHVRYDPNDFASHKPVWTIDIFDKKGPWGREKVGSDDTLWDTILPKLVSYESMTWKEIDANRKYNHSIPVSDIIRAAQKRLSELNLDEHEELFRFRLGAKLRLWGIRDRNVLRLLWWDPDHEICPSELKHT